MSVAGTPVAMWPGGTSDRSSELAARTEWSPIVTLRPMVAFAKTMTL
jgi:hypothetical protein